MTDYSDKYFSLNGAFPDFLPGRIRLVDGSTRTPKSITLEQLNDLGYQGPIESPDYDKNTQNLVWDSENVRFHAVNKTKTLDNFTASNEDRITRKNIKNIIKTLLEIDLTEYTALYKQEQDAYIVKLNKLLDSKQLLTPSDLPLFDCTPFPLKVDCCKKVEFYTSTPYAKILYEKLGIILGFTNPGFPFVEPSGWTKDIDPNVVLIVERANDNFIYVASGYDRTTKSGYYDYEGTQIPLYFINPTQSGYYDYGETQAFHHFRDARLDL